MRTFRIVGVVALLVGLGLAPLGAHSEVTVEGTLVDGACYLGMNATGNDHGEMRACGSACLRAGQPAGLVTSDGTFHAIVAPSGKLADHVGHTVRVTGTLTNGAILARRAEMNADGTYTEIDVSGMM